MTDSPSRMSRARAGGWKSRARNVGAAAAGLAIVAGSASIAAPAAATGKSVQVVEVVSRGGFQNILAASSSGLTLYVTPAGQSCKGGCLSIWPPLLMPKGAKIPLGTSGLGTAKFGHEKQVTYNKQRLYTFYEDSGTSTLGEGVGGFSVVQVPS